MDIQELETKYKELGQDIHWATAEEVFGVENDEVTTAQRRSAKAINLGLAYGMSALAYLNSQGIK